MFKIGEHVIHPGQGVCTVTGFKDSPTPMIELEAHSGRLEDQAPLSCIAGRPPSRLYRQGPGRKVALRLRF